LPALPSGFTVWQVGMELYFQNLTSNEASLEKLVDDMALVVHGANDYASAMSDSLPEPKRHELQHRLQRLRENCHRLRQRALSGAQATDRMLRANPYTGFGMAFAAGLLIGAVFCRKR
jgi:ElaB/YqjD/DUF883 family membrane-anchored ribosome-binding protein